MVELAPELKVDLARQFRLTGMNFGKNGADIELAGAKIELPLEAVEPGAGSFDFQDQIDGAFAHPVDEVSLADPLMAFAAVLPAQLGNIEGPQITNGGGDTKTGVMYIKGGELGQQKAQQGTLLCVALGLAAIGWLAEIEGNIPITEDQFAKHRLELIKGAPEVEMHPGFAELYGKTPRIRGDGKLLQFEGRAGLCPVQSHLTYADLEL